MGNLKAPQRDTFNDYNDMFSLEKLEKYWHIVEESTFISGVMIFIAQLYWCCQLRVS